MLYTGEIPNEPISITFSNDYTETLVPEQELGISVFKLTDAQTNATTQYLPFSIPSTSLTGASSFTVTPTAIEAQTFEIQDTAFIVPSLSQVDVATGFVNITLAARNDGPDFNSSQLSVKVAAPMTQQLTLAPKIARTTLRLTEIESPFNGIGYWTGSTAIETPTGAVSATLLYSGQVVDTLLLDAGVAGW